MRHLLVKICLPLLLCLSLAACNRQVVDDIQEVVTIDSADTISSFTMRNKELREMIIAESARQNISTWINDDGSIGYYLADGEDIDDIVTWAFADYWVRN